MTLKLFKKVDNVLWLISSKERIRIQKEHRDEEHRDGKLLCGKGLRVGEG